MDPTIEKCSATIVAQTMLISIKHLCSCVDDIRGSRTSEKKEKLWSYGWLMTFERGKKALTVYMLDEVLSSSIHTK